MALASLHTARTIKVLVIVLAMALLGLGMMNAFAVDPATPEFERTWARTDKPITDGQALRTWMWGPSANTGAISERYVDSPGDVRVVQYYDKSRMEITHPDAVDDGIWYVTNGLLVNELISGRMQVGDTEFEIREPAFNINVAGDADDTASPTYGTFGMVLDEPPLPDGATIVQQLARDGTITNNPAMEAYGVTAAYHVQVTDINHQIASVFWEFMNSTGTVYEDGEFVEDYLFENPFYATGYPISEAYWSRVKVANAYRDVLIQCFERRCLTYTPGNDPGWEVEAGNVGLHYYQWRYPDGSTPVPSTPTAVAPTATATATATSTATPTPTPIPGPDENLLFATLAGVDGSVSGTGVVLVHVWNDAVSYQVRLSGVTDVTAVRLLDDDDDVLVPLFTAPAGTSATPDGVLVEGEITADMLPEDMTLIEFADLLANGDAYVIVQTIDYPSAELEGMIQELSFSSIRATLSGLNVLPPVETTAASGSAQFDYDDATGTIDYSVSLDTVTGLTAVDIHAGNAAQNGPSIADLDVTAVPQGPFTGIETGQLTADDLGTVSIERLVYLMMTGNAYVDVHTTAYPNGELRGQTETTFLVAEQPLAP